ncbi:MAG TPA: DUF2254 domain-containing protein [Nocardioidaceae bacterium]|jgi:uncharacterized membrane protein
MRGSPEAASVRREATWEYVKGALWVLPTLAVVLALAVGSLVSQIDVDPTSTWGKFVFRGTAQEARDLLIGIAGTMVTVIALVLGLTVVALQLASTQFSPRLLRSFLRDRTNQVVLSVFVATFTYSSAGLYTVGVSASGPVADYPRAAVTGALVLLFASMVMLVFFAHHLAHSIQIDEVMRQVERSTLHVIEHDFPTVDTAVPLPEVPEHARTIPAYASGYVQTIHPEILVGPAEGLDAVLSVRPMIGEHVVEGGPLVHIWAGHGVTPPSPPPALVELVRGAIRIGFERTAEQDVALGIRQLADVASKALSPAINDPYTAVQALDRLSVILSRLAGCTLGNQVLAGADGTVRVAVPARDLEYYLDLGCGQVRRFGASEPRVMSALLRVLDNTGRCAATDEDRSLVARQVELVLDDAERRTAQPADLISIQRTANALMEHLRAPAGR